MTIKEQNSLSTIEDVMTYLRSHPERLKTGLFQPSIKIIYSNKKKRYTEFYRIIAESKGKQRNIPQYFWIRIVKNKPADIIINVLNKQFSIMERVFDFFNNQDCKKLHLSCCKPVLFLPELRALISRECSGSILNSYLNKRIPVFNKTEILSACFNCGLWLGKFHEYFRDDNISDSDREICMNQFKEKYKRRPCREMDFITFCHNDYGPRNIFTDENSIEVIDFVGVEKGFPEQDILFFCNYIYKARFNLLYSKSFKSQMIDFFYNGYKSIC
ncbi:Phosphotransferase family protein [Desulfonema limicola]|uniref:Phosphotransferase family protein n=1 Tax=Desulfonema limicola TaxID=45656 RepID=A0A975B5E1_9BACT|nr:phosphotransferase [Desulfonema limicola]QTA79116.1 Phosphotransferase family protein [Desulfonema limicola]